MLVTRTSGLYDLTPYRVAIIGCGGIGSITAFTLAKMGIEDMILYDFDVVEEENIGTQLFAKQHIGKPKAEATRDIIKYFLDVDVKYEIQTVNRNTVLPERDVIISAVDSIEARKEIARAVAKTKWDYYIDPAMSLEYFNISIIYPQIMEDYIRYIDVIQDEEIPDLPCTSKVTYYTVSGIASFIGYMMREYATDHALPHILALNYPTLSLNWHGNKRDTQSV